MEITILMCLITLLSFSLMLGCGPNNDKEAMLVVSFGTSHPDTRALTLDATEAAFKEKFSNYDIYKAYTSQTIINILKRRDGIQVYNVREVLEVIKKEKYGSVVVQSLHVMNGAEYDDMKAIVDEFKDDFIEIKVGKALLTSYEDYVKTCGALSLNFPERQDQEAIVLMGHGTHHEANAVYPTLEYVFKKIGHKNVYVGTVEGFPSFDDVLNQLSADGIKKVTLMPLMIVAGDHAKNDMAGDKEDAWKTMLKKAGFKVDIYMHGMGESQAIRDIFISHAEDAIAMEI